MRPPLCICEGPYEKREPNAWMFQRAGLWFYYRDICPIHGTELRQMQDLAHRKMEDLNRQIADRMSREAMDAREYDKANGSCHRNSDDAKQR